MSKIKLINSGGLFLLLILFHVITVYSQSPTSAIGSRENIGIYGGPAADLSFSYINGRLFAAVTGPGTLYYTDDTCNSWVRAFPFDSLEYDNGMRGWGSGSSRVLTNAKGWVSVLTGVSSQFYTANVVSFDNGMSFKTLIDPFMLESLGQPYLKVTAIAMSNNFIYTALENVLVRQNDTTAFDPGIVVLNIDTLQGVNPGSKIISVAVPDNPSGYPVYFTVADQSGQNLLYKYDNGFVIQLSGFPPDIYPENIFVHPAVSSGDTVFVSALDINTQDVLLYRSFFGGFGWDDITPQTGNNLLISDVDYSPAWIPLMPYSNGIRISLPGGLISDDMGDTWQGPGTNLLAFPVASGLWNPDIIAGSNNTGVAVSEMGIGGMFQNTLNTGFTNININDFATDGTSVYYVATDGGLAYTGAYYNPQINDYEQWIPPNGFFPVVPMLGPSGVTAVAVDPADANHVVCGGADGFFTTFNGPDEFNFTTPSGWNQSAHYDGYVTDILFVNSSTVIACTGLKFKSDKQVPFFPVGNIWKSTDGGLSWFLVTPLTPVEFEMGNKLSMVTVGGQPVLYCGSGYDNGVSTTVPGALWISTNMGDTWSKLVDGPVFNASMPLPVYDIDPDPVYQGVFYLSCGNVFAGLDGQTLQYSFPDIPYNAGRFTSAMFSPNATDSIYVSAGRNIFKYSISLDDADLKFKGMPGEDFTCIAAGSVLGGSNTGASKLEEAPTYYLDIKVMIEGPFNGTDMNTTLNSSGYLPLDQPFNVWPWFYNGTEHVSAIPSSDVVDWVLIELRKTTGSPSTATSKTQFDRKAAFLLKDGSIVDDDGTTQPRFSIILNTSKGTDKIHAVVYSPSHVEERTATEMSSSKSNTTYSYDFTTGASQAYGGEDAHKELVPGVWGMISGDGDGNGQVDNSDKNDVWTPENGSTGYYSGDFNRDGSVDSTDLIYFWKPNAGRGSGDN